MLTYLEFSHSVFLIAPKISRPQTLLKWLGEESGFGGKLPFYALECKNIKTVLDFHYFLCFVNQKVHIA